MHIYILLLVDLEAVELEELVDLELEDVHGARLLLDKRIIF